MTYRRRSSPLHAARAGVASAWCVAVSVVALSYEHPLVLAVLLAAVLGASVLARAGREVGRLMLFGLPFALLIAAINPIVYREGLTVLVRGGEVPVVGTLDITLEATVYGAILGLRALVVLACFALHSAVVDPDELLRALRRVSFRTALTAALATRMIPVLARDGRRMADAQRCRPGAQPSKVAVVRAVASGALDRAVDVAATLEVRGYGSARRPPRMRRAWSRHDLAFAASTVTVVAVALAGSAPFEAYPLLDAPLSGPVLLTAAALAAAALLPFAQRRGTS